MSTRSWVVVGVAAMALATAGHTRAGSVTWTPEQWEAVDTLKLCTTAPGEAPHCFPVWLVVLDGDVYVRLGTRATHRMRNNATAPFVAVEISGTRFERVRAIEAPESVERVNAAMADKYWTDFLVRLVSHPLTMRLKPDEGAATP